MDVGFLHPGQMGTTLAATCTATALWASAGRSEATRARAGAAGLADAGSLTELCERAEVIVSICPPAAADGVATAVAGTGFDGVFVEANAISPTLSRSIADRFRHYVDGSVIGPPTSRAGTTRLYLCGDRAGEVAVLWDGSALDARPLDGSIGAASALKMAYASWTKIGGALQLAIRALAAAEGVGQALVAEWELSQPGLAERSQRVAAGVAPKAWRFVGEMEQIAAAYRDAELDAGFATAAAEVYARLADFKDSESASLDHVIARLLGP